MHAVNGIICQTLKGFNKLKPSGNDAMHTIYLLLCINVDCYYI